MSTWETGVGLVISNGFEIVGAAKEGAQLHVKARLVLHQPCKLPLHPAMPA